MKKILAINKYEGIPFEIINSEIPEGFNIEFLSEQTQEAFLKQVGNADYILAGGRLKITKSVLEKATNLKMIQRTGVGLDSIDLSAVKEKGIPLYVNQGINAESVSEYALLLILACLRRLTVINGNTKEGIWKKQEQGVLTSELRGKTVGIIGMGNIAKRLVELLKPFGVNILYYNLFCEDEQYETYNNMSFVKIDKLLSDSDIVTIHCALTDDTKNLINADTISKMKDGAILVNTARGGIVNPYDLAEALKTQKLSYAGLDVHAEEPISDDYPLKNLENVILSPHIAGITMDSFRAMIHDAFKNIALFEQGHFDEIETYRYL